MPELMITAEARKMYLWVDDTYGIGPQVKKWCQHLADRALPPTDSAFDFSTLWDEAGKIAANPDELVIAQAVAQVGLDWYHRIHDQISRRRLEILEASEVFRAPSISTRTEVEVVTVYEVDSAAATVAFLFFDSWSAAPPADQEPTAPEPWR